MKRPRSARVLMMVENSYYPHDFRIGGRRALTAAGYQVTVIAPGGRRQPSREVIDGVSVYRYPLRGWGKGFLGYLWEYGYSPAASLWLSAQVFAREGFDLIHAANPPDAFALIAGLYKLLGKRFVFDHHDLAPEMYEARFGRSRQGMVYQALVLLEKLSCRLSDHVIATNDPYQQWKWNGMVCRLNVSQSCATGRTPMLTWERSAIRRCTKTGRSSIVFAGAMGPQDESTICCAP